MHSTAANRRPPMAVFLRRALRPVLLELLAVLALAVPLPPLLLRSRFLLILLEVAARLFTALRPKPRIIVDEEEEDEDGPLPRSFFKAATRGRT